MRERHTILAEASLGRMLQHIEIENSWGLISAGRHEQTPRQRSRATQALASDIRSMGYGFVPVEGGWEEKDMETGEKVRVSEPSFFIPEIQRDELMKLASRYDQEAVVYGQPDHVQDEPDILLIEPPNKVIEVIGPNNRRSFNPNRVSSVYTRVKGKSFTLGEAVAVPLNKTAEELRVGKDSEDNKDDLSNMILNFVKRKGKSE